VTTRFVLGVWTLALLAAAGAIAIVLTSDHTTDKLATIALAVPTELVFVASGLVARARQPENRTGSLLIMVGLAWFLGALSAADQPVVFSAGLVVGGLFIGVLVHLLLAFPSGRLERRSDRMLVAAAYTLVLVGPALVFLFDATPELDCEGPCPENVLAVTDAPELAQALNLAYISVAVVLSGLLILRLAQRWRRASPALRRALSPVFLTGFGFLVAVVGIAMVSTVSGDLARRLNWLALAALLTVPLSFLYGLLRPRFGAATRRLVAELSEKRRPVEVQAVLRRVLRDPELKLGYQVAGHDGYVDVDGLSLDVSEAGGGRAVTAVGAEIIVHDATLRDQPELHDVLGAVQMAFERGLTLRSLESSERRASALIDAVPDNVFRVRADGTFLDAHVKRNVEVLGGAEAFIGRTIEEVMPPEVARELMEVLKRVLATGETGRAEYVLPHETGRNQIEARVVRAAEDEVVAITRDVTDLKQNEEEQAALSRVAVAVAKADSPEVVFDVVTEEVARLLGADAANLVRFDDLADKGLIVGRWSEPGIPIAEVGTVVELDRGPLDRVRLTGRPARGGVDDPDMSPRLAARLHELGVTALVAAPITVSGSLWGAVVVSVTGDKTFAERDEERIGQFASLVAVALANAEAREQGAGAEVVWGWGSRWRPDQSPSSTS
jgi:PAS domain S-box-containing protein